MIIVFAKIVIIINSNVGCSFAINICILFIVSMIIWYISVLESTKMIKIGSIPTSINSFKNPPLHSSNVF